MSLELKVQSAKLNTKTDSEIPERKKSMYVLGIILKKTMFKGTAPMFIMELPPYRIPTFRDLMIYTWQKLRHFVIKAGTYILAVSILVWFMLHIPWGIENKKDSVLGMMGQTIAPVLEPVGFGNWEAASSLIAGLIAKEIVVGTMSEIYVQKEEEKSIHHPLLMTLKKWLYHF